MDAQGSQTNAKEDTVLLLGLDGFDPWVDLSQYGTDLFEDSAFYEDPSARGALDGSNGRELYVQAVIEPTDGDGMLLIHASTADAVDHTYAIFLNSGGDIEFRQGGTLLATITLSVGVESVISIHWSTRNNPDTAGSSDALISECIVYNHTAAAYAGFIQVKHAVATTDPTWALTVGGWWNGATVLLIEAPITKCRIGKAWHPSTEFAEDWIGARPSHASDLTVPDYLLPVDVDSGLGDEGAWTGQANVGWIAEDNARKRWALWSPLVNESYTDARPIGDVETPVQWYAPAPGADAYRMRLDFLRWVPVPRGATHAWVRIHVVSYVTGASDPVPIQFCCVAMSRPPFGLGPAGGDAFTFARVESTVLDVDNGATGVGQWLELGLVRLPIYVGNTPGWRDTVHLALGWQIDPAGTHPDPDEGRFKVKSWHVRPLFKAIGGPGLS